MSFATGQSPERRAEELIVLEPPSGQPPLKTEPSTVGSGAVRNELSTALVMLYRQLFGRGPVRTATYDPGRVTREEGLLARRRVEDERLFRRYSSHGDLRAREELIERFLPLARKLARRYVHAGEPYEDLVQAACVGLVKAVDRYDAGRGNFVGYAVPTMLGELKRHFRDKGWAIRAPRGTQELVLKVSEALDRLPAKLGRPPRPRDVAEALGVSVEEVLKAMEAATAYQATSLDAPRPGDGEDDGWTLGDSVASYERGYELAEIGEALGDTLRAMPDRERTILRLRFENDLTQAEIAERVGVSQMHVSRLLRRALDRLAAAGEAFAEAA